MIVIGILVALILLGFLIGIFVDDWDAGGCLLFLIGVILLFGALIAMPASHMEYRADISEYEAVKQTLVAAREKGLELESAAFQMKVAESNQWLARSQYWNSTIFDIWVPDEIMDLEPIQ